MHLPILNVNKWLRRLRIPILMPRNVSETSKCRAALARYCRGNGLDIGFGGDPIVHHAICLDLPRRYASYADHAQHLHGDATNLKWFVDGCLDFVYSSHVLEDFADTRAVLAEWIRVLKPNGLLVLYLPDEQTYRAHCQRKGLPPNEHHIHADFNLAHVKACLPQHPEMLVIHERFPVGIYSFELVARRVGA